MNHESPCQRSRRRCALRRPSWQTSLHCPAAPWAVKRTALTPAAGRARPMRPGPRRHGTGTRLESAQNHHHLARHALCSGRPLLGARAEDREVTVDPPVERGLLLAALLCLTTALGHRQAAVVPASVPWRAAQPAALDQARGGAMLAALGCVRPASARAGDWRVVPGVAAGTAAALEQRCRRDRAPCRLVRDFTAVPRVGPKLGARLERLLCVPTAGARRPLTPRADHPARTRRAAGAPRAR